MIGVASVYSMTRLSWDSIWDAAAADAAAGPNNVLVCIYLNGGNDGLNTIVPVSSAQYSAYVVQARQHRPRARSLQRRECRHDRDGWDRRRARVRQPRRRPAAATTATPRGSTRSTAMARAVPARTSRCSRPPITRHRTCPTSRAATTGSRALLQELQTGWLGRWLDNYGSTANPLQAISLDSSLSKQIRTSKAPVCAIEDLNGTSFQIQNTSFNVNNLVASLAAVPAGPRQRRVAARPLDLRRDRERVEPAPRPERRRDRQRVSAELRSRRASCSSPPRC